MSLREAKSSTIPDSSAIYLIEVVKLLILGVLKKVKPTTKDSNFMLILISFKKSKSFGVKIEILGQGNLGAWNAFYFTLARDFCTSIILHI